MKKTKQVDKKNFFLRKIKHPTLWLESKPKLAWTLAAAYAILIFVLSSFPYAPPQPSLLKQVSATFKHILEYSIFGFLLLACFRSNGRTRKKALLFAFLLSLFYGMTDEFHQFFVPHRTASLLDVLADSFGGFLGAFLSQPHKKLFKRSRA
ncbi:VanZ family protein [Candidatus Pacearchaeota archaeon]|nr:VanZ family protein [Candidatus Pacearchaeota archaeon]